MLFYPNRIREKEDAIRTLEILRLAEDQFHEHVITVQTDIEKIYGDMVFSELAKAVQQTFGLTLDVSSGELNLEPARSFVFSRLKTDNRSVGSLVLYVENQPIRAILNKPNLQNVLDSFPSELRSIKEKIKLLRLNLKRKGGALCDYLAVFKPVTGDQEIIMQGTMTLQAGYIDGKPGTPPVFWSPGPEGKYLPPTFLDTKPLRTLWVWTDIERMTVDEAMKYLSNLKVSEQSYVSFLNITIPKDIAVLVGPALIFAILLHIEFHVRHVNGVLSIYGDRSNIKFPWIAILPDRYFRFLSFIIFFIAPFVVCFLLLYRLGENVSYAVLIPSSVEVLLVLCVSVFLFLDLNKLRKKTW